MRLTLVGRRTRFRGGRISLGGARASLLPALAVLAVLALAGCSALQGKPDQPTPLDFNGIAGEVALQGVAVGRPVSGDAGCSDRTLIPTAVGFDVSGFGVTTPLRARVYIFADKAAYLRLRSEVDTCVGAWATDPVNVEFLDVSPYVLVVQGPIPDAFKNALMRGLVNAAGNGN
jgi:hypothetical protein